MVAQLLLKAKAVLDQQGTGLETGPGLQKAWESAFLSIGWAHYDTRRAMAAFNSIFDAQWDNGFLPHWQFKEGTGNDLFPGPGFWQSGCPEKADLSTSCLSALPVYGAVLWHIYEMARDKKEAKMFLKEMFPRVLKFHRFLYRTRDLNEESLVYICHPWESEESLVLSWEPLLAEMAVPEAALASVAGEEKHPVVTWLEPGKDGRSQNLLEMLHQMAFDPERIRMESPFLVLDPFFNTLLIWSNEYLLKVGELLRKDVTEITFWLENGIHSMNEKLWDKERGSYTAYDLRHERMLHLATLAAWLPLLGEIPTQDQAEQMLLSLQQQFPPNQEELWRRFSIGDPADATSSQAWPHLQWLLYWGLLRYDFDAQAEPIREEILSVIDQAGFYSYFAPENGKPAGKGDFPSCRTAAVCVNWLEE